MKGDLEHIQMIRRTQVVFANSPQTHQLLSDKGPQLSPGLWALSVLRAKEEWIRERNFILI